MSQPLPSKCAIGTYGFRAFLHFTKKKNSEFYILFIRLTNPLFRILLFLLGFTMLFTLLEIILLQYFQFSVINDIQTDLNIH